jgi:outer membrane protein TolC
VSARRLAALLLPFAAFGFSLSSLAGAQTALDAPAPAAPITAEPPPEMSAAAAQVAIESTTPPAETTTEGGAPTSGSSANESQAPAGLLLPDLLGLAAGHPLIGAAEEDLNAADAREMQSHWAQWSNWTSNVLFTFVPPVGTFEAEEAEAISPATSGEVQWRRSILDWGPWIRLGVSGAIPLWTWGKITGAQDAADAGVDASRVGIEKAQQDVAFQVRRAYLTLLLARDILYLIDDGRGYIDDARTETQKRIDAGEGGGATLDLYKIDAMSAEVDARELQARHLERLSLAGLRLLASLDESQEIADVPLEPFAVEVRPLEEYLAMIADQRADLRMLDAAIRAQQAKVDIEFARYFPDLAVTASASYAYSSATYDNHNPWLNDPFNTSGVGAALVLDYPLDFGMDYYRVEEARAVLRRLQEQREALGQLAETEITDAYEMLVEAQGRMTAWERGRTAARRWMLSIIQGMTLGMYEASDLTDSLVAYFQNELNYLNALYDLDVAWARLAQATGATFLDDATFAQED